MRYDVSYGVPRLKAVRFERPGVLELVDLPVPEPGPAEVRLAPLAVGICGTDAHILDGSFPARSGVVLGHEICGRIDALGRDVRDLAVGDLVTVEPHLYCGTCRYCRLGHEHLCPEKRAFGVHLDGGMAEQLVIPARLAYRLPADLDPVIGCLTEPLACAIHALDRLEPRSGLPALVIGAGPAGLLLTALAHAAGLIVTVAEFDPERRAAALAMGAVATIDPALPDWRAAALDNTGGAGFDFVIEAAGTTAGLETAVALSARRARLLVYGVARPGETAAIPPYDVYAKELTILGTALNPFTHLRAVGLLSQLPLHVIKPGVFPLAAYAEAFAAQHERRFMKVVIAPQPA